MFKLPFRSSVIFSWVLVFISLSLILKSGLFSDDILEYQILKSKGSLSFLQLIKVTCDHIVLGIQSGRFTPFTYFLADFIFWISNTILVYKLIVFGINLLAVYSFTRFLKSTGLTEWIPISLLFFCSTTQFYVNYYDPFTSLHAMYPMLAIFIFSGITSLISFLHGGNPLFYISSVLITLLAILDCEIGFVIYPIIFIVIINTEKGILQKVKLFMPYLLLLIAYLVIFIQIRTNTQQLYNGVATGLDSSKMWHVFIVQVIATLPLTSFMHMKAIPMVMMQELKRVYPLVILSIIAFCSLIISMRMIRYEKTDIKKNVMFFLMGLLLVIFPACVLMISVKYQNELYLGIGYLPVYIQDFGLVMLLVLFFDFVFSRLSDTSGVLRNMIFTLFFVVSVLTFLKNDYTINLANTSQAIPGCLYYKSMKNGILQDCENGSVILFQSSYFWAPFVYQPIIDNLYQKKLQVMDVHDFKGFGKNEKRIFYMLEHNGEEQFTTLYRISANEKKLVKRINYPTGKDFSYFDLISRPL